MGDLLHFSREGPVGVLTLTRPETLNALGEPGDGDQFEAAARGINADESLRVVILTGEGKAFSAGGNVKAMQKREGAFAGPPYGVRGGYRRNVHKIVRAIYTMEIPVIAAVNGPAIGLGCDIACMADLRLASTNARFGVTFLKLGLIPGDGGAWLLPRIIGQARAAELLFTGDVVSAETARAWGLVSEVVPDADLMNAAHALATKIAAQPPHALRMAKMLLRQGQNASYETILEMSAAAQAIAHHTGDHMEGVNALLDKRAPVFRGE